MFEVVPLDHLYVLNYAAKYLASEGNPARHNYGQYDDARDPRANVCEAWRFPIVGTFRNPGQQNSDLSNRVTFLFADTDPALGEISVIGSFGRLYEPLPLERIMFLGENTKYQAVSVTVPKGQLHRYVFLANRNPILDPINPQRVTLDNGRIWSRFFTELCNQPAFLSQYELILLERLTDHVLPFRTPDGQRFLQYFYNSADQQTKETQYLNAYRLDQPVGVVNFIDKLLAATESHHAIDYRICLKQIDTILRRRHPDMEPSAMPKESYVGLYTQMASGKVDGWDYSQYQDPGYFLKLLRRHTYTGAFSHPRHGGNVGAAGWAYLEECYRGPNGESCFNWRKAIETPFGLNSDYCG